MLPEDNADIRDVVDNFLDGHGGRGGLPDLDCLVGDLVKGRFAVQARDVKQLCDGTSGAR